MHIFCKWKMINYLQYNDMYYMVKGYECSVGKERKVEFIAPMGIASPKADEWAKNFMDNK